VTVGIQLFDTLTELCVGPCAANQNVLGDDLSVDAVNKIICFDQPGAVLPEFRQLKQSCTKLLMALMEGQRGAEGRAIKRLNSLDCARIQELVVKIYAGWEANSDNAGSGLLGGIPGGGLVGGLAGGLVGAAGKTVGAAGGLAAGGLGAVGNAGKSMGGAMNLGAVGGLASGGIGALGSLGGGLLGAAGLGNAKSLAEALHVDAEKFENAEDAKADMDLAFQLFLLLRQLHDCNQGDAKQPVGFLKGLPLSSGQEGTLYSNVKFQGGTDDFKYSDVLHRVFEYYLDYTGRIEVCRKGVGGDAEDHVENVYFRIPDMCFARGKFRLTERSKEDLIQDISRDTPEDRLADFLDRADDLQAEMEWQEKLENIGGVLGKMWTLVSAQREMWKNISLALAIIINAAILIGWDHEDKFIVNPAWSPNVDEGVDGIGGTGGEGPFNLFGVHTLMLKDWQAPTLIFDDKVSHVPIVFYFTAKYLGYMQTVTASIVVAIFALSFSVPIVRKAYKNQHNDAEDRMKTDDPNHVVVPFVSLEATSEVMSEKTFGWLRFYITAVYFMLCDKILLYYVVYLAMTIMGNLVHEFFFAFHLLDYMMRDQQLKGVIQAIWIPRVAIFKTLILSVIFMYMFTLAGFVFFHDHFNEGDQKDDNMCNSISQCFIFTMYSGIISNEMWAGVGLADLWPGTDYRSSADGEQQRIGLFFGRWVFDIFFFLLIGVVLIGGVLFGIILDAFAELRETNDAIFEEQTTQCFVCGIEREEFDRQGRGFQDHVKMDHNMWQYVYFIVYLNRKPETEYTGPEFYVSEKLKATDSSMIEFLPLGKASVLEEGGEGEEATEQIARSVQQLASNVDGLRNESQSARRSIEELRALLQRVEASTT